MREELSDPAKMSGYYSRTLRDKRFDSIVRKAQKEERPLGKVDIDRLATRYSDRLLKHRADTIARTETLTSLHAAQYEAMEQLLETGAVTQDQIRKTWSATNDIRTRDTHRSLHGDIHGFTEPFVTDRGARLKYPGDTSLGAGPEEIVNCRCLVNYRINFIPN